MKPRKGHLAGFAAIASSCVMLLWAGSSFAQSPNGRAMDPAKAAVIDHWTKQRRDAARPRDLLIGPTGQGYLRRADGSLEPYGRQITADKAGDGRTPLARPSNSAGSNDTTAPTISNLDPDGTTIGASYTFSATVTDDSGIRSVSFVIRYPDGVTTQSFSPAAGANDTWSVTLQGFFDGDWSWQVKAKDTAKKGGNTATSAANFTVDTGAGGGGGSGSGSSGSGTVTKAEWSGGGTVQTAAGRLYFEMPSNAKRKGPWTGYVCSGTAVSDGTDNRSIILTAAHCVYDDTNKAFARNVMFIPDQAATTGSGTDLNCNNDPLGCWVPSFGVVDANWASRTFPDNVAWDYGYYAVSTTDAHAGAGSQASLEMAAGTLAIDFSGSPYHDLGVPGSGSSDFTAALGYSYSDDPKLMYCAENMTTQGADDWWLPSCGLSGGSSGGPWLQPVDPENGPIVSLNSWGYTNSPGMAGPKLYGSSAECVLDQAKALGLNAFESSPDGDAGDAANCSP